jgi:hypothetical protein
MDARGRGATQACTRARGQIVPLMALAITLFLVSAALAVDIGFWRFQQRLEQTAADSGALAGAIEYSYSGDIVKATAASRAATASNGFTHDGVKVVVTVNYPPAAGSYLANKNALEVLVSKQQHKFFAGLFGPSYQVVGARAVALLSDNGRNCVYALSPTGNSLLINGSTVNMPQCGMASDGSVLINGSTVAAQSISYAVGQTVNGSTLTEATPQKAIPVTDPCPTVSGCRYLTANPPTAGACLPPTYMGNGLTVQPGTYCATLLVLGSNGVTFNPGVYLLKNGMTINGSTNVTGTGVTFYTLAGLFTNNGSAPTFSAPTTGPTAGVLFYQAPSDTNPFTYNGSGGAGIAGMVYVPGGPVVINGSLTQWMLIVGNTVTLNGSGINVGSSAFPGFLHIVLAE